MYKITV